MDFVQEKYEEHQRKLKHEPNIMFSPIQIEVFSSPIRCDTPVELSPFSASYDPNITEKCDVLFRCPVHPTNFHVGYNYTKFLLALLCMRNNISLHLLNLYLPYAVLWSDTLRNLLPAAKSLPRPLPEFRGYGNSTHVHASIETAKTGITYRVVDCLSDVSKIRRDESLYMYFHTGELIIENKYNINVNLKDNFSINEFHAMVLKFRKSTYFAKITSLLGSTVLISKHSAVPKLLQYLFDDLKYIIFEGQLYHANYVGVANFFPLTDYFTLALFDGRILTVKTHIAYTRYCDLPKILTEYYK